MKRTIAATGGQRGSPRSASVGASPVATTSAGAAPPTRPSSHSRRASRDSRTSPAHGARYGQGPCPRGLAIRLRGVVKRFGAITAVDDLDLDVPEGTCVGLLGPNGAGKSTTMKLLTAQAIADEGEIEVLGYALPRRLEAGARRVRRRAAARQPRHDADRRAEPASCSRTCTGSPRAERRAAIERALEIANLARPPRHEGRQALRRHAPAAADRPRARAPAAPGAARRADRRPRPAGAPGAVGADRPRCAPRARRS